MSLRAYKELELERDKIQRKMDELATTAEYCRDVAFLERIVSLMAEYGRTVDDVKASLGFEAGGVNKPMSPDVKPKQKANAEHNAGRRRRPSRVYKNPHTHEQIKTRNPKNRQLRSWMEKYGPDVVIGWGKIVVD